MVSGSWLVPQGSPAGAPGPPPPPAGLPWAMSHEQLTINSRLINELFDYILKVLGIRHHLRIPIPNPAPKYPNYKLWKAQKLRRIILLHGELLTFNLYFLKIHKVFISMMFGPSGNVHDPQKPLFLTSALQNYFKTRRNAQYFPNILFWKIWESQKTNMLEKARSNLWWKYEFWRSETWKLRNFESSNLRNFEIFN